nr:hypothetical protein 9 [bacterium]
MKIQEADDGQGGKTENPQPFNTVWAKVVPVRGSRLLALQQLINAQWYDIEIQWRNDITIDYGSPLQYFGRTLTVHSMFDEGERRRVWKITAYEKR